MNKITAMLALTLACLTSPAWATLYWNVDVKGTITSSTLDFSPDDPLYFDEFPPYTLTCSSNCGTFEFTAMTTGDYVVVYGKQYLDVGGYETINLHDQNIPFGGNETVSGGCDVDCPTGYSGLIDVYDFNSANGSTGVYGPYPGVGSITGNYELFVESIGPEGVGVYNYTATYSTDSVSLVTNAAVPEPSTWALILLGLAGLGFESYRHGRRAIL